MMMNDGWSLASLPFTKPLNTHQPCGDMVNLGVAGIELRAWFSFGNACIPNLEAVLEIPVNAFPRTGPKRIRLTSAHDCDRKERAAKG